MKKTMLVLAMCLTAISLIAVTNTWEGDYNYYWNNANNWSQGHIPLSSEDVVVPSSVSYTYYPSINNYDAVCRTVTVQSNGQLRISTNGTLTITYDMTIEGKLEMVNTGCVLTVNDDIYWQSGSTDNINAGVIYIKDDWTFANGTSCTLGTGNTVIFDGSTSQYLYIYDADATFGNLDIDKSTYIMGSSTQPVRVAGDMTVFTGNDFHIQGEELIVNGTLDIENTAEMSISGVAGNLELNSDLDLYGLLNVGTGNVLAHGEFELETTGELIIAGGNFICDAAYTGNWQYIRGTFNMSSGLFEMRYNPVRILSTCTDNISGGTFRVGYYFSATYAGTFQPVGGEVEVTDDYASGYVYCSNGNYFYDLRISGNTQTSTDLTINNDLIIDSGYFKVNGYTVDVDDGVLIFDTLQMTNSADVLDCLSVSWESGSSDNITAGNIYCEEWTFEDGTNAQLGTGNTVHISNNIWIGDDDAEFGNLEVVPFSRIESRGNRDGIATRVAGYCTVKSGVNMMSFLDLIVAGTMDIEYGATLTKVNASTFTTDTDFTLNGQLNLPTTGNALVHGEFDLASTGELTISGGSFISDAAYSGSNTTLSGTLNLSDGLFEITNNGLTVESTCTDNITGGTIRVGKNFSAWHYGTFQPSGGTVEMKNTTVEYPHLSCSNGNYFHNLTINPVSYYDVKAFTDITIQNNLEITTQGLRLNEHEISVSNNVDIYGPLLMVYPSDVLNVGNDITWHSSTIFAVYEGTINVSGDWHFNDGTDALFGTGNTVNFVGSGPSYITCNDDDVEFGNLVIDKPSGNQVYIQTSSTEPMLVLGDMDVSSGNYFHLQGEDLSVEGTLDIENGATMDMWSSGFLTNNSDFTLNGELDVDGGYVLIHGEFDLASTGILTIDGGSFINDVNSSNHNIYGTLNMSDGLYQTVEALHIMSSANTTVSGGMLRCGSFYAEYSGTFQPTNGIVEIHSDNGTYRVIECSNGNYFSNLSITSTIDYGGGYLFSDITVQNDLEITTGKLWFDTFEATVNNDVNIYGELRMLDSSDILNVGNDIDWYSGSSSVELTNGAINVSGDWYFYDGTNAQLGTGNTVNFVGSGSQLVYNYDADAAFGSVTVDKPDTMPVWLHNDSTQDFRIDGDLTLTNTSRLQIESNTLTVDGTIDIENGSTMYLEDVGGELINNSDFDLNGELDVDGGDVLIHGEFELASTGILTIDGGSFVEDNMDGTRRKIYGTFNISDGLFEITNNGITILASSIDNITGGTIRIKSILASNANTFQPSAGIVEMVGTSCSIQINSTNNFYDLIIGDDTYSTTDIQIDHDLIINNGQLSISDVVLNVENNVDIYDQLMMTVSSTVLNIGNDITWYSSSTDYILNGTINVYGDWYFYDGTDAQLGTGNTVTFVGSENSNLYCEDADACFGNLVVEKDASDDRVTITDNPMVTWDAARVAGNFDINVGCFSLYDLAKLEIGSTLNVNSGGELETWNSIITKYGTGYYDFNVEAGGIINSDSNIFEYVNSEGVNIKSGAIISSYLFWNCTFRYGEPGGTLLTIDNDQTLTFYDVHFNESLRDAVYNVTKNVDAGEITFSGSTGNFDGPDYEDDPYNRLHWSGFSAPTVTTDTITNIDETTATGGGNVTADGGSFVTARGVCWSESSNPTIADDFTTDGTGTGTFVSSITGLDPDTHYYVRAYATNGVDTSYGNEVEFTTTSSTPPDPPTNLTIEIVGTDVVVSWDGVAGADSYKVYSSDDPYESYATWDFEEEVTATTWSETIPADKKFYYVTANETTRVHQSAAKMDLRR